MARLFSEAESRVGGDDRGTFVDTMHAAPIIGDIRLIRRGARARRISQLGVDGVVMAMR